MTTRIARRPTALPQLTAGDLSRPAQRASGVGPRGLSEKLFREQIVGYAKGSPRGLATQLGWYHIGIRPAATVRGFVTPVTGELGRGWPDLVLMRPRDRRLIFAELKADDGTLSADQELVLGLLRSLETPDPLRDPDRRGLFARVDVVVWRPRDLDSGAIAAMLR